MKPRVLHVITVYNGRAFVPRAIQSAVRMDKSVADIDVLVLDDASPEPGWSDDLRELCKSLGAEYYLAPRNLGIPRNVSLGLLTAVKNGYDFVTINNSDVIFPSNLISVLVACCQQENVGSVTAWSNNVSIYSLPNADPDAFLAEQETVDFISDVFFEKHQDVVVDVPAGISFCIMMPVEVVKKVGLMDPIFGRGYCEETDWSLRSLKMGYRVCLSLGTFVYHQGRGSNLAAGLVSGAHTTVPENEVIIDMRYPEFRDQVKAFEATEAMNLYKSQAIDYLLDAAAKKFGYSIVSEWEKASRKSELNEMKIEVVLRDGAPHLNYQFSGFEQAWPLTGEETLNASIARFGADKLRHNSFAIPRSVSSNDTPADEVTAYPRPIW